MPMSAFLHVINFVSDHRQIIMPCVLFLVVWLVVDSIFKSIEMFRGIKNDKNFRF